MQLTLRARILLVVFVGLALLVAGCLIVLRSQSLNLVRPIAFMSLALNLDQISQENDLTSPQQSRFSHVWSFYVPLTKSDQPKFQWIDDEALKGKDKKILEAKTYAEVLKTQVLSGSFELSSAEQSLESQNHFVSFKKVGEKIFVAGTSSESLLSTMLTVSGGLSLTFAIAIVVVAIGLLVVLAYLTRSLNLFARLLDDIGAGKIKDVEIPKFADPEMSRVSQAFTKTLGILNKQADEISKISKIADQDALTGLPNYRAFTKHLEATRPDLPNKDKSGLEDAKQVIALIDIDFFKKINDGYGHLVGDYVLQSLGKTLQSNIRTSTDAPEKGDDADKPRRSDFCARYGGEEFISVFLDCKPDQLLVAPTRILQAIKRNEIEIPANIASDGKKFKLKITASIGVAIWNPESHSDFKSWIKDADEALYEAKKRGRARVIKLKPDLSEIIASEK